MAVNVSGGALEFDAVINLGDFERDLARMRSGIQSLTDEQKKQSEGIESFAKKAATAAAGFLSIQAAQGFIKSMVEVRGEFQQIEVAFTTMLQSKDKADKLMAQAVQLAAITPFTLQQVAGGAKQLLAYGFAAEDVTKQLTSLGNIAAGVGSDLNSIVYLYGTLKASGRVTQIDINQFAGRGIPIYQALADVMKINVDQVRAYVSAGKIGFPQVEAAFKGLTSEGGQFFNLMQEQSKTLTGQLSNLSDAWDRMLNDLGKRNEGLFASAIGGAIDLVNNYQNIIDILEIVIALYGTYRAVLVLQAAASAAVVAGLTAETFAYSVFRNGLLQTIGAIELYNGVTVSAALATSGLVAILGSLAIAAYATAQADTAASLAQDALNDSIAKGNRAAQSEDDQLQGLISTIKSHTASVKDKQKAYDDLQTETNGYLRSYTLEEIAAGKAAGAIALYEGHIRKLIETESQYASYKDIGKKIDEINDKGLKAVSTFDKIAAYINVIFGGDITKAFDKPLAESATNNILNQLKGAQQQISLNPDVKVLIDKAKLEKEAKKAKDDAIKIFNDLFAKGALPNFDQLLKIAPDKDSLVKLQKALTDIFDSLAPSDKTKDAIGAKIRQVAQVIRDSYDTGVKEAAKDVNERKEFLDNLNKLEAAALGKTLDENGEAIAAIKAKYDEQRKKASDLKLGLGVQQRINNLEKTQTGAVKYEQDTQLLKIELEKQKELQIEFDSYVQKFGIDAAKNKYAGIADLDTDYYTKLADEQKKLTKIAPEDLTGNQQERLKMINDLLTEENKRVREYNETQLSEALQASETYNTKALKLHDDYLKQRKILETTADVTDRQGRLAELDAYYQADQEALRAQNSEKIALLQHYNDTVIQYTKQQAKAQIQTLQEILTNSPDLDRSQQFEIANQVDQLRTALGSLNGLSNLYTSTLKTQKSQLEDQLKGLNTSDQKYKDILAKIREINIELSKSGKNALVEPDQYGQTVIETDTSKKFKEIANYAAAAQSSFSQLGAALQDINPDLADTLNTMGQLAGVASNVANSVSGFSSGDIVGGITGAIGAIAGVFSIFGASKKSAEEAAAKMKAYQDNLIIGETEYSNLLRSRLITQSDLTALTVQELEARQQLLATQKQQAQVDAANLLRQIQNAGQQVVGQHTEKHGGFLGIGRNTSVVQDLAGLNNADYDTLEKLYTEGKLTDQTKAWFEELQKVRNQYSDIDQAAADVQQQIKETLTGTTADSIEQSIISGLKAGKRGIADFAGDLADMSRNALYSVFEDKYLKQAVADYYEEFANLSADGVTPEERAQLNADWNKIITKSSNEADLIDSVIGINDSSASTLPNAIRGITTDQADLLAGQFGGQRLATLAGNQIAINNGLTLQQIAGLGNQRLEVLNQIQVNTRKSADNSDYLTLLKDVNISLKSIDKKAGANSATAAANGIPG